jgi:hypothetical protein
MGALDRNAPRAFLQAAFAREDAVAIFLKSYATGATAQRVVTLRQATSDRFLAWLRARNADHWNIYVSVNAVDARRRSRSRDAIVGVRHLFVETDCDAGRFLASIAGRRDLPQPSFLIRTSAGRAHVLWRVRGFGADRIEVLQKALARELGGDTAATSCAQTTRIPGFFNHKRGEPYPVTLHVGGLGVAYGPSDFPAPTVAPWSPQPVRPSVPAGGDRCERARAYLDAVPPAVAGARGDQHTFRVCCRVVRGFDLDDGSAVAALTGWNARCVPPWSQSELTAKVQRARRYGREPFGGLLTSGSQTHA